MDNKTGFFEEKPGQKSSTRLVFVFGMFINFAYCGGMLFGLKTEPLIVAAYFTSIAAVLSGLKLYQNSQENK